MKRQNVLKGQKNMLQFKNHPITDPLSSDNLSLSFIVNNTIIVQHLGVCYNDGKRKT